MSNNNNNNDSDLPEKRTAHDNVAVSKDNSNIGMDNQNDKTVPLAWKTLETQVGGHKFTHGEYEHQNLGMVDLGDGFVLKSLQNPPRGIRELGFYQKVFDTNCSDPDLLELRQFLPEYAGAVEKDGAKFLKLANLTKGFKHPCVMDLKMGRVTYDQEATPEKIEHEVSKYPPLKNLGYQITGMMMYNPQTQKKENYDKPYSRNLTEETIVNEGLGLFFGLKRGQLRSDVIPPLITRLKSLESWFLKQKKFSFIASSLLIIYEGSVLFRENGPLCTKASISRSGQGEGREGSSRTSTVNSSSEMTSNAVSANNNHNEPKIHPSHNACPQKRLSEDGDIFSDKEVKRVKVAGVENAESHSTTSQTSSSSATKLVDVHLIDFAHAFPASDIDHNFLFGLQKLISALHTLVKQSDD